MNNQYNLLQEMIQLSETSADKPILFYHGSYVQDLLYIKAMPKTRLKSEFMHGIWVTPDKSYASLFTWKYSEAEFDWADFRLNKGKYRWKQRIPKDQKYRLLKPGSIYIVEDIGFYSHKKYPFEWYTRKKKVKVIKEIKYPTALDAMLQNDVKIIYI